MKAFRMNNSKFSANVENITFPMPVFCENVVWKGASPKKNIFPLF